MRYVVVGAGAIGAAIGGRLAETGRDVVLVARGEHARVLRDTGLQLALADRELHLAVPTVRLDELALRPQDVLLLAVKSQHSEAVLADLARIGVGTSTAGEAVPVFCVQNGISNEDCAQRYFAHVHGACVYMPATHLEPGVVVAEGSPHTGVLHLGAYPHDTNEIDALLADDLSDSGFVATLQNDVMAWKRAKLIRNVGNALEVLCAGFLDNAADVERVTATAADEARRCFAAAGVSVTEDDLFETYFRSFVPKEKRPPVHGRSRWGGSTWQSVRRGQGSVETDFLNGEIARLGRLYRIATPMNDEIQARMRAVPLSGADFDSFPPAELLASGRKRGRGQADRA